MRGEKKTIIGLDGIPGVVSLAIGLAERRGCVDGREVS